MQVLLTEGFKRYLTISFGNNSGILCRAQNHAKLFPVVLFFFSFLFHLFIRKICFSFSSF